MSPTSGPHTLSLFSFHFSLDVSICIKPNPPVLPPPPPPPQKKKPTTHTQVLLRRPSPLTHFTLLSIHLSIYISLSFSMFLYSLYLSPRWLILFFPSSSLFGLSSLPFFLFLSSQKGSHFSFSLPLVSSPH